ncbi:unnamed protein product, partial [Symbiodinium sp. KB8]
ELLRGPRVLTQAQSANPILASNRKLVVTLVHTDAITRAPVSTASLEAASSLLGVPVSLGAPRLSVMPIAARRADLARSAGAARPGAPGARAVHKTLRCTWLGTVCTDAVSFAGVDLPRGKYLASVSFPSAKGLSAPPATFEFSVRAEADSVAKDQARHGGMPPPAADDDEREDGRPPHVAVTLAVGRAGQPRPLGDIFPGDWVSVAVEFSSQEAINASSFKSPAVDVTCRAGAEVIWTSGRNAARGEADPGQSGVGNDEHAAAASNQTRVKLSATGTGAIELQFRLPKLLPPAAFGVNGNGARCDADVRIVPRSDRNEQGQPANGKPSGRSLPLVGHATTAMRISPTRVELSVAAQGGALSTGLPGKVFLQATDPDGSAANSLVARVCEAGVRPALPPAGTVGQDGSPQRVGLSGRDWGSAPGDLDGGAALRSADVPDPAATLGLLVSPLPTSGTTLMTSMESEPATASRAGGLRRQREPVCLATVVTVLEGRGVSTTFTPPENTGLELHVTYPPSARRVVSLPQPRVAGASLAFPSAEAGVMVGGSMPLAVAVTATHPALVSVAVWRRDRRLAATTLQLGDVSSDGAMDPSISSAGKLGRDGAPSASGSGDGPGGPTQPTARAGAAARQVSAATTPATEGRLHGYAGRGSALHSAAASIAASLGPAAASLLRPFGRATGEAVAAITGSAALPLPPGSEADGLLRVTVNEVRTGALLAERLVFRKPTQMVEVTLSLTERDSTPAKQLSRRSLKDDGGAASRCAGSRSAASAPEEAADSPRSAASKASTVARLGAVLPGSEAKLLVRTALGGVPVPASVVVSVRAAADAPVAPASWLERHYLSSEVSSGSLTAFESAGRYLDWMLSGDSSEGGTPGAGDSASGAEAGDAAGKPAGRGWRWWFTSSEDGDGAPSPPSKGATDATRRRQRLPPSGRPSLAEEPPGDVGDASSSASATSSLSSAWLRWRESAGQWLASAWAWSGGSGRNATGTGLGGDGQAIGSNAGDGMSAYAPSRPPAHIEAALRRAADAAATDRLHRLSLLLGTQMWRAGAFDDVAHFLGDAALPRISSAVKEEKQVMSAGALAADEAARVAGLDARTSKGRKVVMNHRRRHGLDELEGFVGPEPERRLAAASRARVAPAEHWSSAKLRPVTGEAWPPPRFDGAVLEREHEQAHTSGDDAPSPPRNNIEQFHHHHHNSRMRQQQQQWTTTASRSEPARRLAPDAPRDSQGSIKDFAFAFTSPTNDAGEAVSPPFWTPKETGSVLLVEAFAVVNTADLGDDISGAKAGPFAGLRRLEQQAATVFASAEAAARVSVAPANTIASPSGLLSHGPSSSASTSGADVSAWPVRSGAGQPADAGAVSARGLSVDARPGGLGHDGAVVGVGSGTLLVGRLMDGQVWPLPDLAEGDTVMAPVIVAVRPGLLESAVDQAPITATVSCEFRHPIVPVAASAGRDPLSLDPGFQLPGLAGSAGGASAKLRRWGGPENPNTFVSETDVGSAASVPVSMGTVPPKGKDMPATSKRVVLSHAIVSAPVLWDDAWKRLSAPSGDGAVRPLVNDPAPLPPGAPRSDFAGFGEINCSATMSTPQRPAPNAESLPIRRADGTVERASFQRFVVVRRRGVRAGVTVAGWSGQGRWSTASLKLPESADYRTGSLQVSIRPGMLALLGDLCDDDPVLAMFQTVSGEQVASQMLLATLLHRLTTRMAGGSVPGDRRLLPHETGKPGLGEAAAGARRRALGWEESFSGSRAPRHAEAPRRRLTESSNSDKLQGADKAAFAISIGFSRISRLRAPGGGLVPAGRAEDRFTDPCLTAFVMAELEESLDIVPLPGSRPFHTHGGFGDSASSVAAGARAWLLSRVQGIPANATNRSAPHLGEPLSAGLNCTGGEGSPSHRMTSLAFVLWRLLSPPLVERPAAWEVHPAVRPGANRPLLPAMRVVAAWLEPAIEEMEASGGNVAQRLKALAAFQGGAFALAVSSLALLNSGDQKLASLGARAAEQLTLVRPGSASWENVNLGWSPSRAGRAEVAVETAGLAMLAWVHPHTTTVGGAAAAAEAAEEAAGAIAQRIHQESLNGTTTPLEPTVGQAGWPLPLSDAEAASRAAAIKASAGRLSDHRLRLLLCAADAAQWLGARDAEAGFGGPFALASAIRALLVFHDVALPKEWPQGRKVVVDVRPRNSASAPSPRGSPAQAEGPPPLRGFTTGEWTRVMAEEVESIGADVDLWERDFTAEDAAKGHDDGAHVLAWEGGAKLVSGVDELRGDKLVVSGMGLDQLVRPGAEFDVRVTVSSNRSGAGRLTPAAARSWQADAGELSRLLGAAGAEKPHNREYPGAGLSAPAAPRQGSVDLSDAQLGVMADPLAWLRNGGIPVSVRIQASWRERYSAELQDGKASAGSGAPDSGLRISVQGPTGRPMQGDIVHVNITVSGPGLVGAHEASQSLIAEVGLPAGLGCTHSTNPHEALLDRVLTASTSMRANTARLFWNVAPRSSKTVELGCKVLIRGAFSGVASSVYVLGDRAASLSMAPAPAQLVTG